MATAPTPPPQYQYFAPYASNAGYNTTSDPRQAAKNEAEFSVNTGGQLLNQQQQLANQYGQEQAATQNYLNPIEGQLAAGQGGYSADEASQIELSPQQRQDIVTGAGISSGVNTAASVEAANRAAAASGGNPAAMATYRQRAAQTQGAEAGNAETQARIAAQQAGSAGAQAVGNQRLAQQGQALGYYGNLQSQMGTQQATEQGLGNQTFGTETQGVSGGTNAGLTAAGIPTTTDKIIGGIAGAAGALLADGRPNYLSGNDGGQDAVVAEDGPEAIIPGPADVVKAASDPVRSHTTFMADGDPSGTAPGGMPPWLQTILAKNQGPQQPATPQPGQPGWNKTTPYSQLGTSIGKAFKPLVNNLMSGTGQGGRTPGAGSGGGYSGMSPQAASENTVDPTNINDEGGAPSYLEGAGADMGASGLSDIGGAFADGRPSYLAGGRMSAGFHWGMRQPHAPHIPAGGYTPLNNNPKMMADGGTLVNYGEPSLSQYHKDFTPQGVFKAENARADDVSRWGKSGDYGKAAVDSEKYLSGLPMEAPLPPALSSGPVTDPQAPVAPASTAYRYKQAHYATDVPKLRGAATRKLALSNPKADGNAPEAPSFDPSAVQTPMQAQPSMQPNAGQRPQIITKPTLVHLEREDMVVPLSYRPKAKVRPSVAMSAMQPQMGGYRAGA